MKNKPRQTAFNASITGVNPKRTHGFGIYKSERVAWAVRVDCKLLKQVKPLLKAKFGSYCRGIEAWLAALVATEKGSELSGVNPSNTVEIGKLVIERNLRSRRKLVVEEDIEVTERVLCYVDKCSKVSVEKAEYLPTHEVYGCCREHLAAIKTNPKWQVVEASR